MKKFLAFLSITFVLVVPVFAVEDYGLNATAGAAQLNTGPTDPTVIVGKIIGAGLSLIGIVFFILTLYAGIIWMVARGNEENAKKAINTIIAAAIGLIITMSAYAITSFILNAANQSALGGGGGGGNGGSGNISCVNGVAGDTECSNQSSGQKVCTTSNVCEDQCTGGTNTCQLSSENSACIASIPGTACPGNYHCCASPIE